MSETTPQAPNPAEAYESLLVPHQFAPGREISLPVRIPNPASGSLMWLVAPESWCDQWSHWSALMVG